MLLVPLSTRIEPSEKMNLQIAAEIIKDLERVCGDEIQESIVIKRVVAHKHFIDTFNA